MTDRRPLSRGPSPRVGVGCIVVAGDRILLVRNHQGFWSTPGGHLDFGETPGECAARETREEAGIGVVDLRFVAITNDVFGEPPRHYVTIWMRGEPISEDIDIGDEAEIEEAAWFPFGDLPTPLHHYFENLLDGRCLPPQAPEAWWSAI